jgi:alpha-tubulin suppressor-like RCC1 family protein
LEVHCLLPVGTVNSVETLKVVIATKDNEVFSWGCGDNGRLGLGDTADQCLPQRVVFDIDAPPVASVQCGDDCTVFISDAGEMEACGSNRGTVLFPLYQQALLSNSRASNSRYRALFFEKKFAHEYAIGAYICSLEASMNSVTRR